MAIAGDTPRILIGATGSGAGKTTVAVGLIAALRARGMRVAAFKCGPDYLDPTYHARAAGTVSQNLDGWMMGRDAVIATFARCSAHADVAVIEGMMGLFDGASPVSDEGSTAEIAKWLDAPVILVTDASGMARTIAAVAHGFARFDPAVKVAGVICNRIGGRGHLDLLRAASAEIPVLGGLPVNDAAAFPERHLGLFCADEAHVPAARIEACARSAAEWLDLGAIVAIARSAPSLAASAIGAGSGARPHDPRCRIGIALDEAFHFYYDDNLRRLEAFGAELLPFSPIRDAAPPAVDGLYFGGGYPEAHVRELAANRPMLEAIGSMLRRGLPIYAECGGLMYFSRAIRVLDGGVFPMIGAIPAEAIMQERLQALGYVEVETSRPTILGSPGLRFRGHQFRYSALRPEPREIELAYAVRPKWGDSFSEGFSVGNLLASYVHAHWASNPEAALGFVEACAAARVRAASQ
jgi:cobyrinic acid a,c-diamide synthase